MLPLSFNIPAVVTWRNAAIELYEVERDIERRKHSRHNIDQTILPRLIEKHARLTITLAPLKIAAERAEAQAWANYLARPSIAEIRSHQHAVPAPPPPADDLDIPKFLRRQAT